MIEYIDRIEDITQKQIEGFFVGWPSAPTTAKHLEILKGSTYKWLAIDKETGRVVGFINAIADGVLSAYIPLLEVLPAYKGKGIGGELVKKMLDTLADYYMVDLLCDEEVIPFYERFRTVEGEGINYRVRMIPAKGMVSRNYKNQGGI